jgi:hypothetical protein
VDVDTAEPGNSHEPLNPGRGRQAATPRPKGKRADIREIVTVLDLATKGVTQTEIARITGLRQQAVSDICQRHEPTTNTALGVLKANAHQAAIDWVGSFAHARKRGEHRPMRDALIAVGVVAPDPLNVGIQVVIGAGDVSILPSSLPNTPNTPPTEHHNPTLALPLPHEPI